MFWGGGGYSTLWNEAPFHNNQDLYVFKDDYSLVFGKHMLKAGALFSTNKKNEDVLAVTVRPRTPRSGARPVWGARGSPPATSSPISCSRT